MKIQYLKQAFLWLLETVIIAGMITYLFEFLKPTTDFFEIITRFITATVIYQAFVLLFNKNLLDVKRDSLLALIEIYEYALIYYECKEEDLKNVLVESIDAVNPKKVFLVGHAYEQLKQLKDYLNSSNEEKMAVTFIKCRLIDFRHSYEREGHAWKNTLFLKYLK
ncbi:MAG: hypothetical protein EOM28_04730 [Clostridia bacterium]|nr:hypothetical protein [Clostridia bacterium]